MSQNQSRKVNPKGEPKETTHSVTTPVVRVGDTLVRKGDTVTGNPAQTKYLGGHLNAGDETVNTTKPASVTPTKTKSKDV